MRRLRSAPPVVLKFGGELLEDPQRLTALAETVAAVSRKAPLVIVHGGGREIDAALARAGIEKRQVDGLRITDEPTLEVVVAVLAGLVNTRFVAALGTAGVAAVGLTGADARIGLVEPAARHTATASGLSVDLGRVGEPIGTDKPALLFDLCREGYVPVVASIGAARNGRLFNVNADTLAAHLAGRLKSPRLIIVGATSGVLDGNGSTIAEMSVEGIETLVESGDASAGMIAKLAACRVAIESGVREVFVADGNDLAGLTVLVRHGRGAGTGKSTRITKGTSASLRPGQRRKTGRLGSPKARADAAGRRQLSKKAS
jgi:acetylglutamate kinase